MTGYLYFFEIVILRAAGPVQASVRFLIWIDDRTLPIYTYIDGDILVLAALVSLKEGRQQLDDDQVRQNGATCNETNVSLTPSPASRIYENP